MLLKTTGIVLHQLKYTDSGVIAHIYTESHGRQSFLIRGVHSRSSRNRASLLQPLFILDMEVYHRGSRELQSVKEFRNKIPFTSIPYDPGKTAIALFIAEVLYKVLREQEHNAGMFSFLISSIETLDALESDYNNFHLLFMLQLSRHLGFFPAIKEIKGKTIFDLRSGTFVQDAPAHGQCLSESHSELLSRLLSTGYQHQSEVYMNNSIRSQMLDNIVLYYTIHLEGFVRPSSLDILKDVFRS
jgi:DNA repair protein RecO (recombination protein O)